MQGWRGGASSFYTPELKGAQTLKWKYLTGRWRNMTGAWEKKQGWKLTLRSYPHRCDSGREMRGKGCWWAVGKERKPELSPLFRGEIREVNKGC